MSARSTSRLRSISRPAVGADKTIQLRRSVFGCCGVILLTGGIELIELHTPSGARFLLNPTKIVSIREPRSDDLRRFAPTAKCVVVMANAQISAVRETCDQVAKMVSR